jgi:hypothetical protein
MAVSYNAIGWSDIEADDFDGDFAGGQIHWFQDYDSDFGFWKPFAGSIVFASAGPEHWDPGPLLDERPRIATFSYPGGVVAFGILDEETLCPQDVVFL